MRKPWVVFIYGATGAALILGFIILSPKSNSCGEYYRNDIQIKAGNSTISAQLADNQSERQKGLSGRDCLGDKQAMLFQFNKPGHYGFWMKDMKFPLDILWIDADKRVVFEKKAVSPATYPDSFSSPALARYVLEVTAGQADELGVRTGTRLYFN